MIDEGVIKFDCDWHRGPPLDDTLVAPLERWRRRLHGRGLIGFDEAHQVGYGNLSMRAPDSSGVIVTGTQTGHLAALDGRHYTRITGYDIDANRVSCEGPAKASSESLTHMALYGLGEICQAVVHVHDAALWTRLRGRAPTTSADVAYGTPGMARELRRLFDETCFGPGVVAVMDGHPDGLLAFGATLDEAGDAILRAVEQA